MRLPLTRYRPLVASKNEADRNSGGSAGQCETTMNKEDEELGPIRKEKMKLFSYERRNPGKFVILFILIGVFSSAVYSKLLLQLLRQSDPSTK